MHSDEQTTSPGADPDIYLRGAAVFGNFEIIRFIASGGKGRVYEARDQLRDVVVALKVMLPHVSDTDVMRFQKEARLASKLDHPNIVSVYDFRIDDNTPFLVMEYVEGRTLQEILDTGNVLDADDFVEVFQQIIRALIYAHSRGIVHRDIKPSNIVITSDDDGLKAKILDFGIATDISQDQATGRITNQKAIVGSPLYLSPEQSRGEQVTFGSDVYSLGCVMWQTLTGSPPYQADSVMELLVLHQNSNPATLKSPEQVSETLENLIKSMLSKDSGDRPGLDLLLTELENFDSVETPNPRDHSVSRSSDTETGATKNKQVSPRRFWYVATGILIFVGSFLGVDLALNYKADDPRPFVDREVVDSENTKTTMDVGRAAIESEVSEEDVQLFPEGKRLALRGKGLEKIEDFKGNATITEVVIFQCQRLSDEEINILATIPQLRDLIILESPLHDLSGLKKLRGLKKLDLADCTIGDGVIDDISKLNSLERLNLSGTKSSVIPTRTQKSVSSVATVSSAAAPARFPPIASLRKMQNLQFINLSRTAISEQDIITLCSLPKINGITFDGCKNVTRTQASFSESYPKISFNGDKCYVQATFDQIKTLKGTYPINYARILKISNDAINLLLKCHRNESPELCGFYLEASYGASGSRNWTMAEDFATRALKIGETIGDEEIQFLARYALIDNYRSSKQLKQLLSALKKISPLMDKKFGRNSVEVATKLEAIAVCERDMGDIQSAARSFQQAIDMSTTLGAIEKAANERVPLAQTYILLKRIKLAEKECEAALAVAQNLRAGIPKDSLIVGGKTVLASVCVENQNFDEALKLNAAALETSRSLPNAKDVVRNLETQRKKIYDAKEAKKTAGRKGK